MKLYSFFRFLKRHQTVISNRGENETAYSQKHDRYAVQKWLKFMLDLMILNVFSNQNDSMNLWTILQIVACITRMAECRYLFIAGKKKKKKERRKKAWGWLNSSWLKQCETLNIFFKLSCDTRKAQFIPVDLYLCKTDC